MFSDQFARIMETVCAAANLISLIAPNDCGQSLCTHTDSSLGASNSAFREFSLFLLRTHFCLGQCRKGDGSGGGTIFDVEFAQDVFDMLADGPRACAQDDADLIIRFTLCDTNQNLRFARGETQ